MSFKKILKIKILFFLLELIGFMNLFNLERRINSDLFNKSINKIGNNKIINTIFKKFADNGIRI